MFFPEWTLHFCVRFMSVGIALEMLTSLFCGLIVGLADQPAVLHQVVLVPCGQLPFAHDAGKTMQVVDKVLRSPHHLCGRDPLLTRCTLGPESPFRDIEMNPISARRFVCVNIIRFYANICKEVLVRGWLTWRNRLCSRRCRPCWSTSPPAAPGSRCTSGTCRASVGPALWGWSGRRCVGCSPRTRGFLQRATQKKAAERLQNRSAKPSSCSVRNFQNKITRWRWVLTMYKIIFFTPYLKFPLICWPKKKA